MQTTTRNKLGAAVIAAVAAFGGLVAATPAQARPIVAPVHAAEQPGLGDLQSQLQLVLNPGAPRADRAAALEAGDAGLPLLDQIGGVVNTVPSLRWTVAGPVGGDGDTTTANLQVTVDGYGTFPNIELSWRDIDDSWKLTRDSECTIAYYAGLGCTI